MHETTHQRILQELQRVGATQPCPRCGHESFTPLNGHLHTGTQRGSGGDEAASESFIGVTCNQCGYLALHSARTLEGLSALVWQ